MNRKLTLAGAICAATIIGGMQPASAILSEPGSERSVADYSATNVVDGIAALAPSATQAAAAQSFLAAHPDATLRFDQASGSIDAMYHFATTPMAGSPEDAALAFLASHADLLGDVNLADLHLSPRLSREAMGAHLLRFDQTVNGVPVDMAGVGIIVDGENRVRALFGPIHAGLDLDLNPGISSATAVATALADLAPAKKLLSAEALGVLEPSFQALETQLSPLLEPQPELKIFMHGDQPRLAWTFYQYSRNPFGLFHYSVDAQSGEILSRQDQVRYQDESPVDQYADYFPTFPTVTQALRDDCAILDASGTETGTPLGQLRIRLRKFDQSNRVTGADGVLTGTHAFIQNALPTKAPFAQAAAGTYFFNEDNLPLTGRTEERDHLEEPAEHQDAISQFIYITALLEYLDYLHKEGDQVHSAFGSGDFPDSYPNESTPLSGTVHIANVLDPPEDTSDPEFLAKLMGLDNAFAVPVSTEIAGQEVVVNPTAYGHGFQLNDLAIDFSVPMHEGTHATITPIAGFEGSPEGPALNEGQADLWAYTIGETPDLGAYPINACVLLDNVAAGGGDPESYQYIRSAQSQIRYSQLGTRDNQFEEHRDGEIYAGVMWDIREFLTAQHPTEQFVRPDPITGEATQPASHGKEIWERMFLGSMYVLGLTSPDTMVRARDALLIADSLLYPANSINVGGRGRHHALIERFYAARELGIHAGAPLGGRQFVSSTVSQWTADRAAPDAPQNVEATASDHETVNVTWDTVPGAVAYQVLKRRAGDPRRLFGGVPGREYFEADSEFHGYTHVEFVFDGATSYRDHGQGLGRGPGQGLDTLDYEYVVRAIGLDDDQQVGFSDLSGTASPGIVTVDASDELELQAVGFELSGGFLNVDVTLTNQGSRNLIAPLKLQIVDISSPQVTVANADNGGTGQAGDPAVFVLDESLAPGDTSGIVELVFANPAGQFFTITTQMAADAASDVPAATGSQAAIDVTDRNASAVFYHFTETYTGIVPVGTAGLNLVEGADHVDIDFVALPSAFGITSTLTASPEAGGAYPDLDYMFLDADGNELASSGNLGPNESLSGAVVPGETYTLRVVGFANGPVVYEVFLDQIVLDAADAGEGPGSGLLPTLPTPPNTLQFSIDPVTGTMAPISGGGL